MLTQPIEIDGSEPSPNNGPEGLLMSLGIAFKGAEGIVLAADSRVTLTALAGSAPGAPGGPPAGTQKIIPVSYDNATKLLRIEGQKYVGAVTYGMGAFGMPTPRTAHSYMPEFEEELTKEGVDRHTVEDFATRLSNFFMERWASSGQQQSVDMVFIVGGYDEGEAYGRIFEFYIPSRPAPVEKNAGNDFGLVWGGQREYTDRIMQGFDDTLIPLLKDKFSLSDQDASDLRDELRTSLLVRIPYAFLPLQDCVDLAIFLIETTMSLQRWLVDVRGVGGAIDVATITRTEGFRSVQQKAIHGRNP